MAKTHEPAARGLARRALCVTMTLVLTLYGWQPCAYADEADGDASAVDSLEAEEAEDAAQDGAADEVAQEDVQDASDETSSEDAEGTSDATDEEAAVVVEATTSESASASVQLDALSTDEDEDDEEDSTSFDLTELWTEKGTGTSYAITASGTYYLSGDLAVSNSIRIATAGLDVVIDLREYTLTYSGSNTYLIQCTKGSSLTVKGGYGTTNDEAQLVSVGSAFVNAIYVTASGCSLAVEDLGISVGTSEAANTLTNLDASGIKATQSGAVSITNCLIEVDQSAQGGRSTASASISGSPYGIYLGSSVTSAVIDDVTVDVAGSPTAETYDTSSADPVTLPAYGLYSLMSSNTAYVSDSSFAVASPYCRGICIYAKRMELEGSVSLNANGGLGAIGIYGNLTGGVTLNAALSVTFDGDHTPDYSAALVAAADDAFVFADGFVAGASQTFGVTVGDPADGDVNDGGDVVGSCESESAALSVAALLTTALGDDAACAVVASGTSIVLSLDEEKAQAFIEAADETTTSYASLSDALNHATDGDTVKLLADSGNETFAAGSGTYVIDLNGYDAGMLTVSGSGAVAVTDSTDNPGRLVASSGDAYALHYSGTGSMSVSNISLVCVSNVVAVYLVYVDGAGSLSLEDVSLQGASQYSSMYGVYTTKASTISMSGCDIDLITTTTGVKGTGVLTKNKSASIAASDCSITVTTSDSAAGGIDSYGACSLDDVDISVSTLGESTLAWGVRGTSSNASITAEGCTIDVYSDLELEDADYWCFLSGGVTASSAVTWAFDGECSFASESGRLISVKTTPVTLGEDFSLVAESSANVVYATALEDDLCFVLEGAEGAESPAAAFVAQDGSAYDGWTLEASEDGTSLSWSVAGKILDTTTGTSYTTLAAALAGAVEGDVLQLAEDCKSLDAVSVSTSLSIDLNGHTLTVQVYDSELDAVSVEEGVSLSVMDSAGDGLFQVLVEGTSALSNSTTEGCGISAATGTSLVFDGCDVAISYESSQDGTGTMALVGIASEGDVALSNDAAVRVGAEGTMAVDVVGIEVAGTDSADGLAIDGQSVLNVSNTAEPVLRGEVAVSASEISLKESTLMQIYPDEDSDLYQEIAEKFYQEASFDNEEEDGYLYGTNLYYAAPLTLDDGTYVWVFSEPVPSASIGDTSYIVPALIYVQSYYDDVPEATGIVQASDSAASIDFSGTLSVASESGDATGLELEGSGSVAVGEDAVVSVVSGQDSYRANKGTIDLSEIFTFEDSTLTDVFYPKPQRGNNANVNSGALIEWANPEAVAVSGTSAENTTVDEAATVTTKSCENVIETPTSPEDVMPEVITVSFVNAHDSTGAVVAAEDATLSFGDTLSSAGIELPEASDFTLGNISYVFVGWSVVLQTYQSKTYDIEDVYTDLCFDYSISALALGGDEVELRAVYVAVVEGQYLITFTIDGFRYAYGANEGDHPSYKQARAGASTSVPAKILEDDGTSYSFAGWMNADTGEVYTGTLPVVTDEVTYVALFGTSTSTATLTFYHYKYVDDNLRYTTTSKTVAYGVQPADVASAVVADGYSFLDETTVYTMIGWSTRKTDQSPMYASSTDLPTVTGAATYYAIYETADQTVDVEFYVDGELYASAEAVLAAKTLNAAFRLTGADTPADKSDTNHFLGWALTENAESALSGSVVTLTYLADGAESLVFYAVYESYEEDADDSDGDGADDDGDGADDSDGDGDADNDGDADDATGNGDATDDDSDGDAGSDDSDDGTTGGDEADGDDEEAVSYSFTDVQDASTYYYAPIYAVAEAGYMTGEGDGTSFGVGKSLNRQAMVVVLYRIFASGEEQAEYGSTSDSEGYADNATPLSDVKDAKYYTAAVNWAYETGVTTGYTSGADAGTFGVGDDCSFQQFCTFLVRALGQDGALTDAEAKAALASFADGPEVAAYADNSVAYLCSVVYDDEGNTVVGGTAAGKLNPASSVSRERTATVVYRCMAAGLF